jgi:transcriptional regulator with XRE-family HTH domain
MSRKHQQHQQDTDGFSNIKEWLLPLLEDQGYTIEKFARAAGVPRASVYFWLNDKDRPSEQSMASVCRVLADPWRRA